MTLGQIEGFLRADRARESHDLINAAYAARLAQAADKDYRKGIQSLEKES